MQIRECRYVNEKKKGECMCVSDFRFDADKIVYKQTIQKLIRAQRFSGSLDFLTHLLFCEIFTCAHFYAGPSINKWFLNISGYKNNAIKSAPNVANFYDLENKYLQNEFR